ncbi:hypothetical protein, partial [uncultured Nostoc sp.]|uniref:hypothetical protein n=1 Tax=uncultured Nostoc sp. TaxID=340711 RepID=UPI0035CAA779
AGGWGRKMLEFTTSQGLRANKCIYAQGKNIYFERKVGREIMRICLKANTFPCSGSAEAHSEASKNCFLPQTGNTLTCTTYGLQLPSTQYADS